MEAQHHSYRGGKQESSLPLIDETQETVVIANNTGGGEGKRNNQNDISLPDDDDHKKNDTTMEDGVKKEKNDDEDEDDDDELKEMMNESPLWQQAEDDGWELTWPIWHMLPRRERKELAHKHGYKSIGEFEEYMSLQRAERDSSEVTITTTTTTTTRGGLLGFGGGGGSQSKPYANHLMYSSSNNTTTIVGEEEDDNEDDDGQQKHDKKKQLAHMVSSMSTTSDNDGDYTNDDETQPPSSSSSSQLHDLSILSREQLIEIGGPILLLPEELTQQVFDWLPVDMYGTLALVSPYWKHITRTESIYQRLCERLYLNQSKKRQLHVHKFGYSYRTMLLYRPRVRAAGGCYVLKYSHVKRIQRDMWTEIPVGAILETVYYRYLYFQEDGRVLYALTPTPPHEMFRRLLKVCLMSNRMKNNHNLKEQEFKATGDKSIVWGTYQVQKENVTIVAKQPWHTIQFELTIQNVTTTSTTTTTTSNNNMVNPQFSNLEEEDEQEEKYPDGKFGRLTLDRHLSSPSGNFEEWSQDRVEYKIPEEFFRFVKSNRL